MFCSLLGTLEQQISTQNWNLPKPLNLYRLTIWILPILMWWGCRLQNNSPISIFTDTYINLIVSYIIYIYITYIYIYHIYIYIWYMACFIYRAIHRVSKAWSNSPPSRSLVSLAMAVACGAYPVGSPWDNPKWDPTNKQRSGRYPIDGRFTH